MRFGKPEKKGRAQRTRVKPAVQPVAPRKPRPLQAESTVTHESEVEFDPVEGHNHDGVGSRAISHNDLDPASVTADQHHTKQHNLWDNQHHADVTGTPATGDLMYRNSTWQRLAIGASNAVLRVVSGLPSWQSFGHTLLGSDHSDTTGSPSSGDVLYRNGSSQWTRLAIGSSGRFLRVVSGFPSWVTAALSELTGTISDGQHGALSTSSSHSMGGDCSGTTATATVDKVKGKSVSTPAAPADTGKYLKFDGSGLAWDSPLSGGSPSHNLLSSTHPDTVSASPSTGDMVYANATPAWTKLAIGSAGRFLRVVSGIPAWATAAFSDLTGAISDAQHGSLSTSSSHSVGGDLSGTTANAVVAKIQGKTTPVPGAGDNGRLLKYDHASGSFVLSSVNSLATSSSGFQAWRRNVIQNASTSKTELPGLEGAQTGLTMYRNGTIVGCSVDLDADASNVAGWYEVEVYKRTPSTAPLPAYSATGVTARITTTGNNNDVSATGSGSVNFSAGDQITMYDQRSGLSAATPASKATLFVVFD